MVAFLRAVLAALLSPASSSSLDHVKAILTGRPLMDGPLILPPSFALSVIVNESETQAVDVNRTFDNSTTDESHLNVTLGSTYLGNMTIPLEKATNISGSNETNSSNTNPTTTSVEQSQPWNNNNVVVNEATFSLFDWTVAFRHGVRLASKQSTQYSNLTLELTPTVQYEEPRRPYAMSTFGSGIVSSDKTTAATTSLQLLADFDKGQLLWEVSPAPQLLIEPQNSNSSSLQSAAENTTSNTATTSEVLVTAAAWLKRPSEDVFISKGLKSYLNQLLTPYLDSSSVVSSSTDEGNSKASGASRWKDQVDLAISLSAHVKLERHKEEGDSHMNASRTENLAHIKAFAPNYFANLRSSFGIPEASYWKSLLDESSPFVSFQTNSKGANRVGGIFFFTRDGAYMIKSIRPDEVDAFLGTILPRYGPYMKRFGRRSLLGRFCGLYQVQLHAKTVTNGFVVTAGSEEKSRVYTFAVMNAVFPAQASKFIKERFDLKGSTLGRECSLQEIQTKKSFAVLKDLDLAKEVAKARMSQQLLLSPKTAKNNIVAKEGFHIGATNKAMLLTQLRSDVNLLVECNCIDYSLLVGVSPRTSPMLKFLKSILSVLLLHGPISMQRDPVPVLPPSTRLTRIRLMYGPSAYWNSCQGRVTRKALQTMRVTYDDALEQCGVNGGPLSRIHGERNGESALYFMGLIDFLQPYSLKKVVEYRYKSLKYGSPHAGFSCVPPKVYADRFLAFLDRHMT